MKGLAEAERAAERKPAGGGAAPMRTAR